MVELIVGGAIAIPRTRLVELIVGVIAIPLTRLVELIVGGTIAIRRTRLAIRRIVRMRVPLVRSRGRIRFGRSRSVRHVIFVRIEVTSARGRSCGNVGVFTVLARVVFFFVGVLKQRGARGEGGVSCGPSRPWLFEELETIVFKERKNAKKKNLPNHPWLFEELKGEKQC